MICASRAVLVVVLCSVLLSAAEWMSRRPSLLASVPAAAAPSPQSSLGLSTRRSDAATDGSHGGQQAGLGDRRARGEAGMSVLKWRLAQLSHKTRDRDRAAQADRDDIELISDEASSAAASSSSTGPNSADTHRSSGSGSRSARDGSAAAAAARQDKRRPGLREQLGVSQVQRGREIRRVELRRKKSRKHSDDDDSHEQHTASASAEDTTSTAAEDAAGADGRTAKAADGKQHTTRTRRDEESKQQLEADGGAMGARAVAGAGGVGGGEFLSAVHHSSSSSSGGHDSRAEAHEDGEEERRRRKDKHEGQSLRVALDTHSGPSGSGVADRSSKRSGHGFSARPLTLSQQLQRLHRDGNGPTNGRHTAQAQPQASISTSSRPHTPPASSSAAAAAPDSSADFPTLQSVDELTYSLSSPPPPSLPCASALFHSLAFFRSSSVKRRWHHFRALCVSPPCEALLRSLYFLVFVDNFQNDGRPMRDALLADVNRHFTRLVQLLDIALTLPYDAHASGDSALYTHLLTVLPEEVAVSSSTPTVARPASEAAKTRLLTALPLLLSSAVFSLLYSLFPLSRHLLTASFLHRVDCALIALTCGFDMADSTVARQRAVYFTERATELFSLSSTVPSHSVGGRASRNSREGRPVTARQASSATAADGSLFSRGDWARDEKERREQVERRKALASPYTPRPSALSAEYIRDDRTLSPYQRVLLLELLIPPHGSRQQLLNANALSPLLTVGLQRRTPDSSWRLEHKVRYVVPAPAQSSHGVHQRGSFLGAGADNRAGRAGGIEQEAERWVRRMRGEGSGLGRRKGKAGVEYDEASVAASRTGNSGTAAQSNAASSSSSAGQRDRVVEGDPLAVLTPRTRKLVLRYSAKDDHDDYHAHTAGSRDGKPSKGVSSPAFVSAKAKGAAGAHSAEQVLALDLAAHSHDTAKTAQEEPKLNSARITTVNG